MFLVSTFGTYQVTMIELEGFRAVTSAGEAQPSQGAREELKSVVSAMQE